MHNKTANKFEHTFWSLQIDCNFLFMTPDNRIQIFIAVLQEIHNVFSAPSSVLHI